jgi:hypothetical protein
MERNNNNNNIDLSHIGNRKKRRDFMKRMGIYKPVKSFKKKRKNKEDYKNYHDENNSDNTIENFE